jgi:hypothetical protein
MRVRYRAHLFSSIQILRRIDACRLCTFGEDGEGLRICGDDSLAHSFENVAVELVDGEPLDRPEQRAWVEMALVVRREHNFGAAWSGADSVGTAPGYDACLDAQLLRHDFELDEPRRPEGGDSLE